MRLGGPVLTPFKNPDEWISQLKGYGYSAAFCPAKPEDAEETIRAYVDAANAAGVMIAEVGAFGNNPISRDTEVRRAGIQACQERLALADQVGARCCVNVAGSCGERWAGPHADNLDAETFNIIVDSVRKIIDAVNPTRSFYALETMPWMYPDSTESYARLIRAIDRDRCAVHLDPVNLVSSPQRYFDTGALIRGFVEELGPHIKSCHAKDILLSDKLTVHLDEVQPGLGNLDYRTFIREVHGLDPDMPMMLEHLQGEEPYRLAAEHVREVAKEIGVPIE